MWLATLLIHVFVSSAWRNHLIHVSDTKVTAGMSNTFTLSCCDCWWIGSDTEVPHGFSSSAEWPFKKHFSAIQVLLLVSCKTQACTHAHTHRHMQNPSFLLPYEILKFRASQEQIPPLCLVLCWKSSCSVALDDYTRQSECWSSMQFLFFILLFAPLVSQRQISFFSMLFSCTLSLHLPFASCSPRRPSGKSNKSFAVGWWGKASMQGFWVVSLSWWPKCPVSVSEHAKLPSAQQSCSKYCDARCKAVLVADRSWGMQIDIKAAIQKAALSILVYEAEGKYIKRKQNVH